ncbi:MAG: IreB family regulatory phosphoprotein [Tissierellia bacterium]|nr:IreB family regulatory phosphoprotein [Tissierellia bacterium]
MSKEFNETMYFKMEKQNENKTVELMRNVYNSLLEKEYEPVNQIIGYIISGDPTYITSHNNARRLIRQKDRSELLEELLLFYLKNNNIIE